MRSMNTMRLSHIPRWSGSTPDLLVVVVVVAVEVIQKQKRMNVSIYELSIIRRVEQSWNNRQGYKMQWIIQAASYTKTRAVRE